MRYTSGLTPTDYQYTGQRNEEALGLYFYNARWYDPQLGRFAQADTLIPGAGNPLAWDRFAYTLDNPLRYTDPSGHFTEEAIRDYLVELYGERKGLLMLLEWQQDTEWWKMLSSAQAGDYLYGTAQFYFGNRITPVEEPFLFSFARDVMCRSFPENNRDKVALVAGIMAGFVGMIAWGNVTSLRAPWLLDKWWYRWFAYPMAVGLQIGVTYLLSTVSYRKKLLYWWRIW